MFGTPETWLNHLYHDIHQTVRSELMPTSELKAAFRGWPSRKQIEVGLTRAKPQGCLTTKRGQHFLFRQARVWVCSDMNEPQRSTGFYDCGLFVAVGWLCFGGTWLLLWLRSDPGSKVFQLVSFGAT